MSIEDELRELGKSETKYATVSRTGPVPERKKSENQELQEALEKRTSKYSISSILGVAAAGIGSAVLLGLHYSGVDLGPVGDFAVEGLKSALAGAIAGPLWATVIELQKPSHGKEPLPAGPLYLTSIITGAIMGGIFLGVGNASPEPNTLDPQWLKYPLCGLIGGGIGTAMAEAIVGHMYES